MPVFQRIAQQCDAAFRQLFQHCQLLLRPFKFDHRFVLRPGGLQQLIIYAVLCAQPQTLSLPRLHHQRHLPAGQGGEGVRIGAQFVAQRQQLLILFGGQALFQLRLLFGVVERGGGAGDIGFDDQRVGLLQPGGQPGRQRRHIDGAHMDAAHQMQPTFARQGDVQRRISVTFGRDQAEKGGEAA